MNNQQCMVRRTIISLKLDELYFCSFIVSLETCNGSCNSVEDPFGRICVPNKMEDVIPEVFNIFKGTNESKTFVKPHNSLLVPA